jgi:hypothetical protein
MEGNKIINFPYWHNIKIGTDIELEFLGQNQMWNWFELLRARDDLKKKIPEI